MLPRRAVTLLLVLLAATLLAAGCGGDGDADTDAGDGNDAAVTQAEEDAAAPEPGSPEAARERVTGSASFSLTPQVAECMEGAGFATDAPSHGALVAWRHPDGARAAVANDSEAAIEVAGMIGTAELPANVDGRVVVAGPTNLVEAARSCLGAG